VLNAIAECGISEKWNFWGCGCVFLAVVKAFVESAKGKPYLVVFCLSCSFPSGKLQDKLVNHLFSKRLQQYFQMMQPLPN